MVLQILKLGRKSYVCSFLALSPPPFYTVIILAIDESPPLSLDERDAYKGPFASELGQIVNMRKAIVSGENIVGILYAYRSISKALPVADKDSTEEQKKQISQEAFQALYPEMEKIMKIQRFHQQFIKVCVTGLQKMQEEKKSASDVMNEQILDHVIELIDVMSLMSELKGIKPAIQLDFSRFKREFAKVKGTLPPEQEGQIQKMIDSMVFFVTPMKGKGIIMMNLKDEIQKMPQYHEIVGVVMGNVLDRISEEQYLTPNEKHRLHRVALQLMFIYDGDGGSRQNVFRPSGNTFKLSVLKKVLYANPVIPIYGDMFMATEFVIRRCFHFEENMLSTWVCQDAQRIQQMYLLKTKIGKFENQYNAYVVKFNELLNYIKMHKLRAQAAKGGAAPKLAFEKVTELYNIIIEGFKLLSDWSSAIKEQAAYKHLNPVSDEEYKKRLEASGESPKAGADYEKVVRYNYDDADKSSLVKCIGLLKGLGDILHRNHKHVYPSVRRFMHFLTQEFVQTMLARPLRKAYKKKRPTFNTMQSLREYLADWSGKDLTKDYLMKKKEILTLGRTIPERSTSPSVTQIFLLRRMMHTIFSDEAPGMNPKGFMAEKDLKKEWLEEWKLFYERSRLFQYFLNYNETIDEICDMSCLWYREFFLALTNQMQFPIDFSLPYILTQFLPQNTAFISNLPYIIDIYNDSAEFALKNLRQRFLYDECEAEVNLAFDQMMFGIAHSIYGYYKVIASRSQVSEVLRVSVEQFKNVRLALIGKDFKQLCNQVNLRLLGRSVNLNSLLSQHMNLLIRENLEYAIKRFESSPVTAIIEIDAIIENIRGIHALLIPFLSLDPFSVIFNEINETTIHGRFSSGRILQRFLSVTVTELMSAHRYNHATSRFVPQDPSQFRFPKPLQGKMFGPTYTKMYSLHLKLTRGFFGIPHVEALFRLLHPGEIPVLVKLLQTQLEEIITNRLDREMDQVVAKLPEIGSPPSIHGVIGAYGYFEKMIQPLAKDEIFPTINGTLSDIGNIFCLLLLFERVNQGIETLSVAHSNFFLGIRPVNADTYSGYHTEKKEGEIDFVDALDDPFKRDLKLNPLDKVIQDTGADIYNVKPDNYYYVSDSAYNLSFYQSLKQDQVISSQYTSYLTGVLKYLREKIRSAGFYKKWHDIPNLSTLHSNNKSFVRGFNALQFAFTRWTKAEIDGEQVPKFSIYGDGWSFGGCALIYLLDQESRFKLMDYTLFVLNLQHYSPVNLSGKERDGKTLRSDALMLPFIKGHLSTSAWLLDLNLKSFSILKSYYKLPNQTKGVLFHPKPDFKFYSEDEETEFIKSYKASTEGDLNYNFDLDAPQCRVPVPYQDFQKATPYREFVDQCFTQAKNPQ